MPHANEPAPRRPRKQIQALRPYRRPPICADGLRIRCERHPPNLFSEDRHPTLQIAASSDEADCVTRSTDASGGALTHRIRGAALWLIPPGVVHEIHWRSRADLIVIDLDEARARELCPFAVKLLTVERLSTYVRREEAIGSLSAALHRFGRNETAASNAHVLAAGRALASFVLQAHFNLERREASKRPQLSEAEFQRVEHYMLQHLKEKFSLGGVAKLVGRSPPYFCTLFKARCDYTPREYFNRSRVRWAKEQIETGQMSVSAAAYTLGIYDLGHFGRLFRRFLGAPPSFFRPRAGA